MGPTAVAEGRRVEAVTREEIRVDRPDVGRADPGRPRLLATYLLGDLVQGNCALGEVAAQRGRERRDASNGGTPVTATWSARSLGWPTMAARSSRHPSGVRRLSTSLTPARSTATFRLSPSRGTSRKRMRRAVAAGSPSTFHVTGRWVRVESSRARHPANPSSWVPTPQPAAVDSPTTAMRRCWRDPSPTVPAVGPEAGGSVSVVERTHIACTAMTGRRSGFTTSSLRHAGSRRQPGFRRPDLPPPPAAASREHRWPGTAPSRPVPLRSTARLRSGHC